MHTKIADFLAHYGRTEPWRCAYVGGTFDCLHRGHLNLLSYARALAERVVVGVNTDEFAARYKRPPVMALADRMAVLRALRMVDAVVVNIGDEDSRPAIEVVQADCIIHGSDWSGDSLHRQMGLSTPWLAARGIDLVIVPYTECVSTTQIIQQARDRALSQMGRG